jgi:hypothetical protein
MEIAITKNKAELERLEGIIRRNQQSFYEIGMALREIRDKELYRDVLGYETYEAYVKARWDFSRRNAYYLMDASTVIENVNQGSQIPAPTNERQVRPLTKLPPEQQPEAWQQAVATAPDGKVTAAHVQRIVKGMMGEEKPKPAPKPQEPSDAMAFAAIAISQLERIHPKDPKRSEALVKVERWIQKHKGGER